MAAATVVLQVDVHPLASLFWVLSIAVVHIPEAGFAVGLKVAHET